MYATSSGQRETALKLIRLGRELGTDTATEELVLGTALALSFRDVSVKYLTIRQGKADMERLAGSVLWEEPLNIAVEVILSAGGCAAFIAKSPTPTRRYLVEQMACVEILGGSYRRRHCLTRQPC